MSEIFVNGVSYRQQFRKCGKADCRCIDGELHGPYWYANNTKYIGRELPKWLKDHLALLESEQDNIQAVRKGVETRKNEHWAEYNRAKDELRAIDGLLAGAYVDQKVLKGLQLEKFSVNGNGHK